MYKPIKPPASEDVLPTLAIDLVEALDKAYPHRCPEPGQSQEDIWMYSGARKLVDSLLSRKEAQERYGLEGEM